MNPALLIKAARVIAACERMLEVCAKATAEPWVAIHGDSYCAYPSVLRKFGPHFILYDTNEPDGEHIDTAVRFPGEDADANFIAQARTMTAPALRSTVIALRHLNILTGIACHRRLPCAHCTATAALTAMLAEWPEESLQ